MDDPFDIEGLQAELSSLPGVRAVRVVTSTGGRISEIHVVSEGDKSAKQLVRDIQTVALAKFDLRIDYRVVSVVQFGEEPIPKAHSARPILASVSWRTDGTRAACRVELDAADNFALGESTGGATTASRPRLAAAATVDALLNAKTMSPDSTLDVADVSVAELGGRRVALVMLVRLKESAEEVLVGSALVRTDESEAVARAVLDAFNRRLAG